MRAALFSLASLSLLCAADGAGLVARADPKTFGLYAYGNGIGGFPVFYQDGLAYVGDGNKATNATSIIFTNNDTVWSVNANTTASANGTATVSNATFYVPSETSSSHAVGFLNGTSDGGDDDVVTSGFRFYGHVVLLAPTDGGKWQSLFSAAPTDTDMVWALEWNSTDTDAIPISLKDSAPTKPPQS